MKRTAALLFLCILALTAGASPTTKMRQLSVDSGLSYYDVTDIEQDGYGFIWISTNDGLNRYDGYGITSFRHHPEDSLSISYNRIKSLNYDEFSGELWAGTDGGGINVFDYGSETFRHLYLYGDSNPMLADNDILDMASENNGRIWVATRRGVCLVKEKSGVLDVVQFFQHKNGPLFRHILQWGDILFIVYNTEIHRYKQSGDSYTFDKLLPLPENGRINNICVGADGRLYVSCRKYLSFAENAKSSTSLKKIELVPGSVADSDVFNYFDFVGEDPVFAVQGRGIFRLKMPDVGMASAERIETSPSSFWAGNMIRSMVTDRTGTLWIASASKGVGIIDLAQMQFNQISLGESDNESSIITALFMDTKGNLWSGTQKGGLYRTSKDGVTQRYSIPSGSVSDIYETDGIISACVMGNVMRSTTPDDPFSFERYYAPDADHGAFPNYGYAYSICRDGFGFDWIACRKGVFRVKGGIVTDTLPFDSQSTVSLSPDDEEHRVWLTSTRGGIVQFNLSQDGQIDSTFYYQHVPGDRTSLSSNVVWTLLRIHDGRVFAGTDAGICVIDPVRHSVTRFPGESMLHNCKALSINEDSVGILWVNTPQGVVRIDPETGVESVLDASDGLSSSSMTEAAIITPSDILYVGTNEGVNWFRTADVVKYHPAPKVVVSGFRISSEKIRSGEYVDGNLVLKNSILEADEIRLKHDQNNISFEVSLLSFNNPARNRYCYRLRGYDDIWTVADTFTHNVSYVKLKPGTYYFEVYGVSEVPQLQGDIRSIKVRVQRAPWASIPAFLGYSFLLAWLLAMIAVFYKRQQKAKQEMLADRMSRKLEQEANENKLRFYANVTHELRTPLTLVTAPLMEMEERDDLPEDVKEKVSVMVRNGGRLMELVNQFLDLRKIENQTLPLSVEECDCVKVIKDVASRFEIMAERRGLVFRVDSPVDSLNGWMDADKVSKILVNLLSNAFKYTSPGGSVSVLLTPSEESILIEVRDTGKGIAPEDMPRIFERFYQGGDKSVSGTGIGLELVHRLVEIHKGRIDVSSELGKGSSFRVILPISRESFSEMPASEGQAVIAEQEDDIAFGDVAHSRRKVLVVEDDDDMRYYIESVLDSQYEVSLASDGVSGFEKALELVPDIIISDMMMPGMDGAEFCRRLGDDYRVSHIPVIIVSAKDAQTEGLLSGAVDYIMKPFVPQNLLLKIHNLLRYWETRNLTAVPRETIKDKIADYQQQREKIFLEKAFKIVEDNIADGDFNVGSLYRELAVSKSQLHNKMTALTGDSASAFIRNIRLDKALQLLQSGHYSITEVLYSVGFNSPSYFSKKFKDRFGVSPSEYIESHSQ